MKKYAVLIASLLLCNFSKAQYGCCKLETVPESLKKDAAIITFKNDAYFEVTDIDRAYLTVHKIMTVLNAEGKNVLDFSQFSNKFVELKEAEIKVFDAKGKQTAKYKMKDMNTVANGEGLIDDGKVTYFVVPSVNYPVTVEYSYEIKFKGTLMYPDYEIQEGAGEAVVNSSFTAKVPADIDLRYRESNIALKPEITSAEKYKTYKWSVNNIAPITYEEGAVSFAKKYPKIILAPNRFRIYNTDGDMTSWKNFGQWENNLITNLNELSQDRKLFFKDMVKNAATEREKIKLVYNYLQKNFRYVSIQLGIGGFQPFPASFTDQKKYGDCKGLSYYMFAVLNSLGIKSHIALVNAGYNEMPADPAFPCNEFNHVILCVPQKTDSIWLECTSKSTDFGVLGNFTENRNALLITENGGQLVATPASKSADNVLTSSTLVKLAADGSGTAQFTPKLRGAFKQSFMHALLQEKKEDQKEFLIEEIGLKQPDEFTVHQNEAGDQFEASFDLTFEKIPEFTSGSKMFLALRLYKLWNKTMPKAENRLMDYYFRYPFQKTDTTIYHLPDGMISDALPTPKNLQCDFGKYSTKYWYNENEQNVYSVSNLTLAKYKIPATDYTQMKNFFDEVAKDELQRIVVKKE